jgi:hypothetical protein
MDDLFSLAIVLLFLGGAWNKLKLLLSRTASAHPGRYATHALRLQAYAAESAKAAFHCMFAAVFAAPILPVDAAIRLSSFSGELIFLGALTGAAGLLLSYRIQPHAPNQAAMTPRDWVEYFRAGEDPQALAEKAGLTEMRGKLEALGFVAMDLLTARTTILRNPIMAPVEIFAQPDAFATPEIFKGWRLLAFRTRLQDASIVETALLQPAKSASRLVEAIRRAWMRLLWHRRHRPRAGYWSEIVHSSAIDAWERHRRRVEDLSRTRRSEVASHDRSSSYVEMAGASLEISALGRLADLVALIVPLPTLGAMTLLLVQLWIGRSGLSLPHWMLVAMMLILAEWAALWLSRRLSRRQLIKLGRMFGYSAKKDGGD